MTEVELHDVVSPPHLVFGFRVAEVVGEAVALFLAEKRAPAIDLAKTAIARDVEVGYSSAAALGASSRAGIVGSGDTQHVLAEIAQGQIGGQHLLVHVAQAPVTVDEKLGRQRPAVPDAPDLDVRDSFAVTVSERTAAGRSEHRLFRHISTHVAELAPDVVALAAIPVDLGVGVVPV